MNVSNHTATGLVSPPETTGSAQRKIFLAAGIFYILTFVSIPTLSLYGPIHEPGYILRAGSDNPVMVGGLLEIIVALCGIITAVILYPLLKKYGRRMSLGLVASRILEASTMFAGVAFLLTVVSLHQSGAGAPALATSQALVTLYDRIFLLGQGFMPAINDLLLGILLFRSGLAPRGLALIGIIGAAPLLAGYLAVLFGLIGQHSPLAALSALLVALFEFSLGIYFIMKGLRIKS